MSTTLFPVQNDVARAAQWLASAMDHGSETSEPAHLTDIVDPNFITKFNTSTVTVSTETLTTVSDLDFPIGNREIWEFEYTFEWTRSGTTLLELALVVPTGVQVYSIFQCAYDELATPSGWCQSFQQGKGTTLSKVMPIINSGDIQNMPGRIYGVAVGDSAGGTINFQFSKGDSNGTNVTIDNQSKLIARRFLS